MNRSRTNISFRKFRHTFEISSSKNCLFHNVLKIFEHIVDASAYEAEVKEGDVWENYEHFCNK